MERVTTATLKRRYSGVPEWFIGSSANGDDGSRFLMGISNVGDEAMLEVTRRIRLAVGELTTVEELRPPGRRRRR
jgi:hypothetical protein